MASGALNTCRQVGGALIAQMETFLDGMRISLLIAALVLIAQRG